LYLGFLREATRGGIATVGAAVLALVGALAVACFVRLTGMIFLGNPRTEAATHAHESPLLMRLPLAVLAVACLAIGLVPQVLWIALRHVTGDAVAYAPFLRAISMPLQILAVLMIATLAALLAITRRSPRQLTWDCGYAQPTARMQYTSGGLSEWFTARILPRFLTMSGVADEPFADRIIRPLAGAFALRAMRLRWLQQGRLPLYLLYSFVTLIAGVAWVALFPLVGGLR
jgi:hydrogenase-4 component B